MALVIRLEAALEQDHILLTRGLTEAAVTITAKLVDYEVSGFQGPLALPLAIDNRFPACITPTGLALQIDPVAVWVTATEGERYKAALDLRAAQMQHPAAAPG